MASHSQFILCDSLAYFAVSFHSPVAFHSQFFLCDSLACVAVFFQSSVVSHSQSLLFYRQVFYTACLPCHYLLCFSRFFLSLALCFFNLCSLCSAASHTLTFLSFSLLFCSIFSLSVMESKQLAMPVSENSRIWWIQGLWKSPTQPNPF